MSDDSSSLPTSPPPPPPTPTPTSFDSNPATVLPVEAARAVLQHWWREPLAGLLALAIGVYDSWKFGRDAGLSASLDEALVIGGIVLIAGSKHLFGSTPPIPIAGSGPNGGKQP
jgi:hypothetical protein